MKTKLLNSFNGIFEPELQNEIEKYGALVNLKEDELLIETGDQITTIPLVLNGIIKIFREDENGDEILLYFLEEGDPVPFH